MKKKTGDTKSTTGRLPPDEREAILPMREDERPLYGQRQSTEMNEDEEDVGRGDGDGGTPPAAGADAERMRSPRGKQQQRGIMQATSDTIAKALGRK